MSIKELRFNYQRLADKGIIQENRVTSLAIQTVLEAGQQSFHQRYFGEKLDKEIEGVQAMNHEGKEHALTIMENFITDLEKTRRAHKETLTTSDFPLALARARQAASRPGYTFPESSLPKFASRRVAQDFKVLKGTRPGVIGHKFLPVRPESTNIEYTKFFSSDEGYTVADYTLGIPYTWEMFINDDIGEFTAASADAGNVARRTRTMVLLDAALLRARVVPLVNGEQGPTIENLDLVADFMAQQTDDRTGRRTGRKIGGLFVPTRYERKANASMAPEKLVYVGGASGALGVQSDLNPVYQLAPVYVEDMIADLLEEYPDRYAPEITADSWLALAPGTPLELAALRGYEGGPKTFTRSVNVDETDLEGDFDNRTFAIKVTDVVGGFLSDPYGAVIAQGD